MGCLHTRARYCGKGLPGQRTGPGRLKSLQTERAVPALVCCTCLMLNIPPPGQPGAPRLRCTCCGVTAEAGEPGWRSLISTSHSGRTTAEESAGHTVGLDLCRACLRQQLRGMLGLPANAAEEQRAKSLAVPQTGEQGRAQRAVRSMERTEAFIRASERRLDGWRRDDHDAGHEAARSAGQVADGNSAAASNGADWSLGATKGELDAAASTAQDGQAMDKAGSSQRTARSQSRA